MKADNINTQVPGTFTGLERPRMNTEEFLSRSSELLGTSLGAIAGPGKGEKSVKTGT